MENDSYFTLEKPGRYELKVKGSRFIGHAMSATLEAVAERLIDSLRKQYHDATHHCFAYRIGKGDHSLIRFHDGGEPAGTAGRPILEAIDHRKLTDVVCVVVRYFGGVKLGTGGLARAYGETAAGALDAGEAIEKYFEGMFRLIFPYELAGIVMGLVKKYGGIIDKADFSMETQLDVRIRKSKASLLRDALLQATSGKIRIEELQLE